MSTSPGVKQQSKINIRENLQAQSEPIKQLPPDSYKDIDESELLNPSKDDSPRQRRKHAKPGFCNCRRLSKSCIAVAILLITIVVSVIGAGGYWAFKVAQINGQSPPWYPTPKGGTVSQWQESYEKAKKLVEKMSLVEKVNITTGTGWGMDFCVGTTAPALEVGFPALCLQDGPLGLRFADHATSFPAGITVGATWNRDLMRRRGIEHARQAKKKGINVLLGPSMGPIGRNPAGGRNWEGFGSDPVLQAVGAYETILGIQSQGVMATAKHFIGNEQEHFRKSFEWGLPEALSSNIDDRTLHEIYAWPFAQSVRAGVASVMCSYQMVNNSYACSNSKLMNGILKDELGFQGFVQSDWSAQRSGVASALAGLDMSMPGDGLMWMDGNPLFGEKLTIAVLNRSVPLERMNDMATRIVASWYQLGQDSWNSEGPNFSSWTNDQYGKPHDTSSTKQDLIIVNKFVDAETNASRKVAREVATEGIVLLKNEDNTLPLTRKLDGFGNGEKKRIAIIGEDAGPGKGPNYCTDRACNQGTLSVGWGSGSTEFTYLVDPLTAIDKALDHSAVALTLHLNNNIDQALRSKLKKQDLCLVFANSDGGEGYLAWSGVRGDRNDLELQKEGAILVRAVAESCGGPTIVVIHAIGPVILEQFVNLPNVKAILHANLPGQESGNALADVLFGNVDSSGRLPYTIGKSMEDYGPTAPVLYYPNRIIPQVNFDEGIYIDYRHFDKAKKEPRYAFGHGLSYTTFRLSELNITSLKNKSPLPSPRKAGNEPPSYGAAIPDPSTALFPSGIRKFKRYIYPYISSTTQVQQGTYPYPEGYNTVHAPSQAGGGEGGNPSLFEEYVQVEARLTNTGDRTGKEVVQVYVSFPESITETSTGAVIDVPPQVLRNFTKMELSPGKSEIVRLTLSRKDLSYWSVIQQNWVMPEGQFGIKVGRSSRDIALQGVY